MEASRLLDGRLKIRHLVILTAIADAGGVAKGAESLQVTQPVVTRALKETEDILGLALFERHARGVTPTLFGEAFLATARAVIGQLRSSARHLAALSTADLGSVRVGTHLAGSNLLLPRAIARVKHAHPNLTVVVREATPDALELMLLNGEIDMVVGRLRAGLDERLRAEPLCVEPMVVATRTGHPALAMTAPRLADLVGFPWVLPLPQTNLRQEIEQAFVDSGAPLPANRIECTSLITMRPLITAGDVVAILPQFIVTEDDRLARIDLPELRRVGRSVGVTVVRDLPLPPGGVALLQRLREEGRRLDPGQRDPTPTRVTGGEA